MEEQLHRRLSRAGYVYGLRRHYAAIKRERDEAVADRDFRRAGRNERDMSRVLLRIEQAEVGP